MKKRNRNTWIVIALVLALTLILFSLPFMSANGLWRPYAFDFSTGFLYENLT